MRRETAVFALAGVSFGFVAGYMTANWRQPSSTPGARAKEAARIAAAGPALDPALTDTLGRYPGDPQLAGLRAQIDSLRATPAGVSP